MISLIAPYKSRKTSSSRFFLPRRPLPLRREGGALAVIMTDTKITKQTIENITDKIAEEFNPAKIILFGSYGWGMPREDSDIDLFIIKETGDRRIDRERSVRKIIFGIETPLDILVYTPDEVSRRLAFDDPFVSEILTKGKTLYEAK